MPVDIVSRSCPVCRSLVSVPSDSDREVVNCADCGTELVTRCGLEGVDVFVFDDRRRIDAYEPPVETLRLVSDQWTKP